MFTEKTEKKKIHRYIISNCHDYIMRLFAMPRACCAVYICVWGSPLISPDCV